MRLHTAIGLVILSVGCSATETRSEAGTGGHAGSAGEPGTAAGHDAGPDGGRSSSACTAPEEPGACEAYIPRFHHDPATGTCNRFIYGGCGANANNYETLAACEEACGVSPRAVACSIEATDPHLPGVTVRIEGDRCLLPIGGTHVFRYSVQVDKPINFTVPPKSACGRCGGYTSDPLSLVDYAIEGNGHHYCVCDQGCCPEVTAFDRAVDTGTFQQEIEWTGHEWNGPSDTNAPLGPAFPPGSYFVTVTFAVPGFDPITAQLPIELYDPSDPGSSEARCEVDGHVYASREAGIADPISCNTCECFDGQLICTDAACPKPCPDGTAFGTSCSQCGPGDGCEVLRHDCLPICTVADDCKDPELPLCASTGVCANLCG